MTTATWLQWHSVTCQDASVHQPPSGGTLTANNPIDLSDFGGVQAEVSNADDPFHLSAVAETHNRSRYCRMVQGPGDGHFARGSVVPFANLA